MVQPPAPAAEPEPLPPVQEQPPAAEAPVAPPEEQPVEAAPPMLDGATRLASSWCLVFVSGPNPVSTIVLGKKVTLGRSAENDVTILDPLVSRQHALVELSGGGYLVADLHSANGTFINDVPVTETARLRVGDLVKFGGTVFRFQPFYEMP
jgi:SARP family transcriptional regulator, regulator of embCAB operon